MLGKAWMKRLLLVLALVVSSPAARAQSTGLSEADMIGFLAQCIGTDAAGGPVGIGPERPSCPKGPQTLADRAEWRKHDWPDTRDPSSAVLGYQASDSVLDRRFKFPVIDQTFDFGDGRRRFGTLDRPGGDGGDAIVLLDGAAWGFFTEDGGGGQQWFVAERCRDDPRPEARLESWLMFAADAQEGGWRDQLARLTIARTPEACPSRFSNAYTRYRRDTIVVPVRIVDGTKPQNTRAWPVDTIVSEHYGGRSIEAANHLERFYFGRGLGKYRWERWENLAKSTLRDNEERSRTLAASGRCMPLPYSESPGPDWSMVDCRTWTNLVRQRDGFTVTRFGWPGNLIDAVGRTGR